jgi:hypothetical protein
MTTAAGPDANPLIAQIQIDPVTDTVVPGSVFGFALNTFVVLVPATEYEIEFSPNADVTDAQRQLVPTLQGLTPGGILPEVTGLSGGRLGINVLGFDIVNTLPAPLPATVAITVLRMGVLL